MADQPRHSKQTGNSAIHPPFYLGTSDPASPDTSVTADGKIWIDQTTGTTLANGWLLKLRTTSNTVWTTILDLATTLALKANLASPTFTGTPAAPTPTYGDNDTSIATTAFVQAAIATTVDDGNSSTADTIDFSVGNVHKSTLTNNVTYTFTAPPNGSVVVLKVIQGAGPYAITWPAAVHWPGGTAPTLTATSGKVDVFTFLYMDSTYYSVTSGQDYTA